MSFNSYVNEEDDAAYKISQFLHDVPKPRCQEQIRCVAKDDPKMILSIKKVKKIIQVFPYYAQKLYQQLKVMIKPNNCILYLETSLFSLIAHEDFPIQLVPKQVTDWQLHSKLVNYGESITMAFDKIQELVATNKITRQNYVVSRQYYEDYQKIANLKDQQQQSMKLMLEVIPFLQKFVFENTTQKSQRIICLTSRENRENSCQRRKPQENRLDKILNLKVKKPLVESCVKQQLYDSNRRSNTEKMMMIQEIENKKAEIRQIQKQEKELYWQIERESKIILKSQERKKTIDDLSRYKGSNNKEKSELKAKSNERVIRVQKPNKENQCDDELIKLREELSNQTRMKEEIELSYLKTLNIVNSKQLF